MAIRLSGINSGLDTDAIVQELVSAYSLKTQKYEKAQTKLSWKQDVWKNLNTKIYGLYNNVSNLRLSSAYSLRKTTVSDSTKATVTASSSAPTGTQQLKIINTAQAGYITGGKLDDDITGESKLSDLGFKIEGETDIEVRKNDGTTETITVKKGTTVSEFVNSLKEAGLNASFDENNKRIFVNAKESGKENDFTLVGVGAEGEAALQALKLDVPLVKAKTDENGNVVTDAQGKTVYEFTNAASAYEEAYNLYQTLTNSGILTDDADRTREQKLKELLETQIAKYDQLERDYTKADYEHTAALNRKDYLVKVQNAVDTANTQLDAWNKELGLTGENVITIEDLNNCKTTSVSGDRVGTFVDTTELTTLLSERLQAEGKTLSDDEKAKKVNALLTDKFQDTFSTIEHYLSGTPHESEKETVTDTNGTTTETEIANTLDNLSKKIEIAEERIETAQEDMDSAREAQEATGVAELVKVRDEEIELLQKAAEAEAKEKGETFDEAEWRKNLDPTKQVEFNTKINNLISNAFRGEEIKEDPTAYTTANASKIDASDAKIELNGVEFTSSDNSFSINGLTINALAATTETISITTSVDTQGIYDKIKDFLTEYNNIINEMTKLYNADSASDYEPLTDEEKEAMSEEQIEKWETKIKDSLLRRDTTLNSIMSGMINSMAQAFEINGEKVSLSTFGISTLGFLNAPDNENYAYHIDGDEDDENTSSKEDKLMEAIQDDPDKVMEFMKKLTSGLYTAIDNKMKSTDLSSAYKVYNDKEMDKQYKEYSSIIKTWEDKVSEREDYYYKKFSQMEVALSKLNSQTSSLSGLLGT